MTIIVHYVTSLNQKKFTKKRLEVQPPVKLKSLLSCVPAIDPYKEVREDLVPCILETGDEIDDNHPWIQAWEPVASLKWGFNVVWLPRGKEIPKTGTVAEEWKLRWRFPNSEIAITCLLLDLNAKPLEARQVSQKIIGFLPKGDISMPLSTRRAKLVYLAANSLEAQNRKTGYMTNDWTTDAIYDALLEEIHERTAHPDPSSIGILFVKLEGKHRPILFAAELEINRVFKRIYSQYCQDVSKVPNPYFNINFSHQGKRDNFPIFNWNDPNIAALCSLISIAAHAVDMPITQENISRLNVIVRQYREGDKIGWHTDWKGYSEEVVGLIITNKDPSRGLCFFRKGRPPLMLHEEAGVVFKCSGDARWKYKHGFCARPHVEGENPKQLRTSVTFRFFKKGALKGKCRKEQKPKQFDSLATATQLFGHEFKIAEGFSPRQNGPHMNESLVKVSKCHLGKAGFNFGQGAARIDPKGGLNMSIRPKNPKPARPTDMHSYNLMKMLGLNAVKPGVSNSASGNQGMTFQSQNNTANFYGSVK